MVLDSSGMSIDAVLERVLKEVRRVFPDLIQAHGVS
jgi:phage terminase Nu1 subunit (DNA packaging protein)